MRRLALLLALFAAASYARAPRIWLDSTLLATLQAKKAANSPDYVAFKAIADGYRGRTVHPYVSNADCGDGTQICWTGGYGPNGYQGGSWLDVAIYLGVMYQLTGDTSYSDTVSQVMDAARNSWDGRSDCATYATSNPITINGGWTARTLSVALAIGYDFIYDTLTPTQRAAAADTIYCDWQWDAVHGDGWPGRSTDATASFNFTGGYFLGFGLAGIAIDGDDARFTTMNTTVRGWWNSIVVAGFANGFIKYGYPGEGFTNYGHGHIERLLTYALAVKTYAGVDISSGYANLFMKAAIYNIMPARWRITAEADWIPATSLSVGQISAQMFNLFAYLLNGTTDGQYAQYMFNNIATTPDGHAPNYDSQWQQFLFESPRTAASFTGAYPTYYASAAHTDGHVYTRSDWGDSATWSTYAGGIGLDGGHEFPLAGNVSLNRAGDYLLPMIASWRSTLGMIGTPQIYDSPNASGYRANTLYFYDYPYPYNSAGTVSGSVLAGATTFSSTAAVGRTCGFVIRIGRGTANDEFATLASSSCGTGTAFTLAAPLANPHANGEIIDTGWTANYLYAGPKYFGGQINYNNKPDGAWATTPDLIATKQAVTYTYALSNLTGAYDLKASSASPTNRTLRSYYRTFVWLGDGYYVVKDRAISKAARAGVSTYEKMLFWHLSPNTTPLWTDPSVVGSRVTTAPNGTSKLVIDTLLPTSPSLTIRKVDAVPSSGGPLLAQINAARMDTGLFETTPITPLTYRLEVRDPSPADTFEGLTVLNALDSAGTAPAAASIGTVSATHRGVYIADAAPRVAVLPIDDTVQYTNVSFTQAMTGTAQILVAGLAPGYYDVTQGGSGIVSTSPVGPDGTLYFNSTNGGAFVVQQNGTAVPPTITTTSLANGTVGIPYSQTLTATGDSPITWSVVTGSLPAWASLDAATGAITGTPLSAAVTSFTVRATNAAGTNDKPLSITTTAPISFTPLSVSGKVTISGNVLLH